MHTHWILLDITSTQTTKKLNSSLVFLITSNPYFGSWSCVLFHVRFRVFVSVFCAWCVAVDFMVTLLRRMLISVSSYQRPYIFSRDRVSSARPIWYYLVGYIDRLTRGDGHSNNVSVLVYRTMSRWKYLLSPQRSHPPRTTTTMMVVTRERRYHPPVFSSSS